jgi:hypothetical protein
MPHYGLEFTLSGNLPILVRHTDKVNFDRPFSMGSEKLCQIEPPVDIEDVARNVAGFVAR